MLTSNSNVTDNLVIGDVSNSQETIIGADGSVSTRNSRSVAGWPGPRLDA